MSNPKKLVVDKDTKILVPASSYDLESDRRLLIPFTRFGKIGFVDNKGDIIVEPKYSMYYGDARQFGDYIEVAVPYTYGYPRSSGAVATYFSFMYGVIDHLGRTILEAKYRRVLPSIEGKLLLFTVQRKNYDYGVLDINGNEVVPFGRYRWIDGFDSGYTRVLINEKWGIINEFGEEVLPVKYDEIWNFYNKGLNVTRILENSKYQYFPIKEVPTHTKEVPTHTNYEVDDEYDSHYGEYAGSYAQDVMGYSDEEIDDAFDGDPDAYWNID